MPQLMIKETPQAFEFQDGTRIAKAPLSPEKIDEIRMRFSETPAFENITVAPTEVPQPTPIVMPEMEITGEPSVIPPAPMVSVMSPTGVRGKVSQDKLPSYLNQGYQEALPAYDALANQTLSQPQSAPQSNSVKITSERSFAPKPMSVPKTEGFAPVVTAEEMLAQDVEDAKYQERQLERQKIADKMFQNINEYTDILAKPLNPNRYYDNMSTGNKILAAVSLVASGIGSGLTGQQNMAMNVINKAIDADIEAQKTAYENARTTAQIKDNAYGRLMQNLKDDDAAYLTLKDAHLKKLQFLLNQRIAQSNDANQKANLQLQAQNVAMQLERNRLELQAKISSLVPQTFEFKGRQYQGDPEKFVPGLGFTATKEDRKEIIQAQGDLGAFNQNLTRLKTLLEEKQKSKSITFSPEKRQELEDARNAVLVSAQVLLDQGTISSRERDFLEGLVRDPNAIFSLSSKDLKNIQNLQKIVNQNFSARYQNRIMSPDPYAQQALKDFRMEK